MSKPKRPEKKSETLDVRLPYSVKRAFMAATKERGETASSAIRGFIDRYVAETEAGKTPIPLQEVAMTLKKNRLKTLTVAAGTAMGVFAFSAMPSAADDAVFEKLDRNADGVLTVGEIAPGHDAVIIELLDTDKSGDISKTEFKTKANGTIIHRSMNGDDSETRVVKVKKINAVISDGGENVKTSIREDLIEAMPGTPDEEIDEIVAKILEGTDLETKK